MSPTTPSSEPPPAVSVIIPCLNREQTVRAAVKSVLDQDFTDLEVIAVDDSSDDGTRAVLETIDDPRMRMTVNPGPRGQSRAENVGIALARAPWIAFQDSDDLWRPGKLSAQMARLAEGGFVAAYCALAVHDGSRGKGTGAPLIRIVPGSRVHPKEGDILPALRYGSFASTQTLVIAADALAEVGGWDEDCPALVDWELMLRIAKLGPVAFVPEVYVDQVVMPDSVSRSDRKRLTAYHRLLLNHGEEISRDSAALAHLHYRIAGAHRAFGEYSAARAHAWRATRLKPTAKRLAMVAYTGLLNTLR